MSFQILFYFLSLFIACVRCLHMCSLRTAFRSCLSSPTGSGDHFLQARVATTSFLTVPIQILYLLRSLECFWLFDLGFVWQSLSAFLCILRFVCCCWSGNIFLHCCIAALLHCCCCLQCCRVQGHLGELLPTTYIPMASLFDCLPFFWGRVWLCSPGWLLICNFGASAFRVREFEAYTSPQNAVPFCVQSLIRYIVHKYFPHPTVCLSTPSMQLLQHRF